MTCKCSNEHAGIRYQELAGVLAMMGEDLFPVVVKY
jgi:hypothetical protein